jgi:hypothetical protein
MISISFILNKGEKKKAITTDMNNMRITIILTPLRFKKLPPFPKKFIANIISQIP